jgi:cystathionine beta-lyase
MSKTDPRTAHFDNVTVEQLRARGSLKWSKFPDALGAFVAESDFGLAPVIAEALHAGVKEGRTGYLTTAATNGLAEATAAWCAVRYGWSVAPAQVQPMADVLSVLALMLDEFTDDGAVIVPTPAYMPFLDPVVLRGREIVEVPAATVDGRAALDLDGIEAAFAAGARVLLLCNPWNPVGRVLSIEELCELATLVDRYGARVFADEIHAPVVFGSARHVPYASVSAAAAAHSMTALSASKAFNLPGLKCAQLVLTNEPDVELFRQVGTQAVQGASGPGVLANTVAYAAGGPWLDGVLGYLDENRRALSDLLAELLPEVTYAQPEGTYIAWLDCRTLDLGPNPAGFFLERAGVALTDGPQCGKSGSGFARLVFATPRPILERMIKQMAAAVRSR